MADTSTTHLGLTKQDPSTAYDYEKQDANLDTLDAEVFARGKKFNGESVGADGEFHINSIPYADNLQTSAGQSSNETYIIRTSGGEASIEDGDAWLMRIKGARTHTGYIPQSITMTVIPMARTPDPAITATLDEATFEAYVEEAGTYTITYTTEWSTSPTLYGLTVSNTPINGDSITMEWDGESDATVTVDAAERPTPDSISATIDDSVFVAYVQSSGTTTLTYSTSWSADPTLYGITVTGTPIAGDVITVVYVKEVRGTITQSDPQTFVSTGWNLYNHSVGYARVIKYSTTYGFKIAGTYTALEFATTLTGSRTTITPVSGAFAIPNDGYVFVTGGNDTDTEIWMTWSDWGTQANGGIYAGYSTTTVDFSSFMETNFPYGLMQVGTARDEINFNTGVAVSYVVRQAYNATNLANAKASGRQYEYDENYIYLERATPVQYSISVDGGYTASDHGLEWFTGTDQAVYAETIYGANLKNKLERDVLTISQQTLSAADQAQVRKNIGASRVFIDTDTLITNLDNIPINAHGRINLDASVSPYETTAVLNFYCYGNQDYRSVAVTSTYSNTVYMNSRHYSSTWKGWYTCANDSTVVHNTGDETIAGEKIFADPIRLKQPRYGVMSFRNSANNPTGFIQLDSGNSTNQTLNRLAFAEYSPKSTADTGNTGYYETYQLPVPDEGRTANASYAIMTSKRHMRSIGTISSGTGNSVQVTFSEAGSFLFIVDATADSRMYFGMVHAASSNTPYVKDIYKGSSITVTTASGKVTIGSSSSTGATVYLINLGNTGWTSTKV